MSDDDACYILASWAKRFSSIIFDIIRNARKPLPNHVLRKVGEIATRLRMVSPYIDSLPRYWIEPDVEQLCRDMLKNLVRICLWPERLHILPGFVVPDCNRCLADLSAKKDGHAMRQSIYKYFSDVGNRKELDDFNQDCRRLYEALAPTNDEEAKAPPPNLRNFSQHDHVDHNQALFKILQKHCQCRSSLHGMSHHDAVWHPTRLCLEGDSRGANFDILVSSLDMSSWQEFRLSVPSSESHLTIESEILVQGHFCNLLEEEKFARIAFLFKPDMCLYQLLQPEIQKLLPAAGRGEPLASILGKYELTSRNKIMLSYAVSRAYWQFYDSELMRTKWSSETIWFMPTTNSHHSDRLPLQAFVTFPFGVSSEPLDDFIRDVNIPLNHRCPRIFALGILLLEIGLAKPFPRLALQNLVAQANFDHRTAMNQLETLRNAKWEGFSHMGYFVDAVEYCVNGGNFIESDDHNKKSKRQKDLAARRKDIHDRVVLPLAWLALQGFKGSSTEITHISRIAVSAPSCHVPRPVTQDAPQNGLFHSGQSAAPRRWLENLKGISAYVDDKRRAHGMTVPIRVAILDTGINTAMPFYKDEDDGDDRLKNVTCWRDFVNPDNLSTKVDEFGHGTLMARLVAELIPFAEIIAARVARNTEELSQCQSNIAEAIRWAGREGADIISMSFGFPRDHRGIIEAIQQVATCDDGVVFFASAGNSAYEDEAFPARHPGVISVYATDPYGTFAKFNSRRPSDGTDIFGTFSDCIPPHIEREFQEEYQGVCQPGSSVATAVAAGIGAIMLAYTAVLPRLVQVPPSDDTLRVLRRIHDSRGMAAVLRVMAMDMSRGRWFVNPAQFWLLRNKEEARYHAISTHLWDIDRGML